MEFSFSVAQTFGLKSSGIVLVDEKLLSTLNIRRSEQAAQVITAMGVGSQLAQGLPAPITTIHFIQDVGHNLMLAVEDNKCLGLLKEGVKHLFMLDTSMKTHEMDAYCCLDFYTPESVQRNGIGFLLFTAMERYIGVSAFGWAFDRPSSKLKGFLNKYYSMSNFTPQANNFLMHNNAVQLWGTEYQSFRRSAVHYIPTPFSLPINVPSLLGERGVFRTATELPGASFTGKHTTSQPIPANNQFKASHSALPNGPVTQRRSPHVSARKHPNQEVATPSVNMLLNARIVHESPAMLNKRRNQEDHLSHSESQGASQVSEQSSKNVRNTPISSFVYDTAQEKTQANRPAKRLPTDATARMIKEMNAYGGVGIIGSSKQAYDRYMKMFGNK